MSEEVFSCMARSDLPWECTNCGLSNISATLFDSTIIDSVNLSDYDGTDSINRSSTSSCSSLDPGPPVAQSSPSKQSRSAATNLRTLTINFQSLFGKKEVFWSLVDVVKPDIIFGSETWLKPDKGQSEIFPPGFDVYRKDRTDGYGGVLFAVNSSLVSHQLDIQSDAEFVATKIISGKQSVIIGALYRPTNNSQTYMDSLNLAIEDVCTSNPGSAIWISGDINLPDIDWATDQVTGHQYPKALNESFLQLLARTGMEQLVDFLTRGDNTLDIIITNRPSLINRCEGMPGLSDHDIVYADWNAQATRRKPIRHKIYLWKRTNFDVIREQTRCWAENFASSYTSSSPVEVLASQIEQFLDKTLPGPCSIQVYHYQIQPTLV